MKLKKVMIVSSTVLGLSPVVFAAADKAPLGRCYGVVGKGEGGCGGRDPNSGQSWSCAGNNPTADTGWKEMTKADCDKTPKHKDATGKHFEPSPVKH